MDTTITEHLDKPYDYKRGLLIPGYEAVYVNTPTTPAALEVTPIHDQNERNRVRKGIL